MTYAELANEMAKAANRLGQEREFSAAYCIRDALAKMVEKRIVHTIYTVVDKNEYY